MACSLEAQSTACLGFNLSLLSADVDLPQQIEQRRLPFPNAAFEYDLAARYFGSPASTFLDGIPYFSGLNGNPILFCTLGATAA